MRDLPPFRYIFRLSDGRTLICDPSEAKRVMDKRGSGEEPQVVWEISGTEPERLWPGDIRSWTQEELKPIKELKPNAG